MIRKSKQKKRLVHEKFRLENLKFKKQKKKSGETYEATPEEIPLLRKDFTKTLILKNETDTRPLWVCPDKHIFLEAFSPLYQQASDFLVTIAEPDSRANLIHEYQLTRSSLGAAISVGLSADQILKSLDVLSKVKVPQEVVDFVRKHAESYGKVKLVLQKNSYFLESTHPQALQALLKDPVIAAARLKVRNRSIHLIDNA
jgi:DNA excision repair protein ERCC-3